MNKNSIFDSKWNRIDTKPKKFVDFKPAITFDDIYYRLSRDLEEAVFDKLKAELSSNGDLDSLTAKESLDEAVKEQSKIAKDKLKRVLFGLCTEPRIIDQFDSLAGQQILDLFYRLTIAENYRQVDDFIRNNRKKSDLINKTYLQAKKEGLFGMVDDVISENHMVPLLRYVQRYEDFQIGLFELSMQTMDLENLIVEQVNRLTVPDMFSLYRYNYKDPSKDPIDVNSLRHDCLYNAITLAVCARLALQLSGLYQITFQDSGYDKVDSFQQDQLGRRRAYFEHYTIVALSKAEALYGIYLGMKVSGNIRDTVNLGSESSAFKKRQLKQMLLNLIANKAPFYGWSSTDQMAERVAPKLLLFNKRLYKNKQNMSEEDMVCEILNRLESSKDKSYRNQYYVYASEEGRQEFKGLARVESVRKRADEIDQKRNRDRSLKSSLAYSSVCSEEGI
ncbi:hypothetical protein [Thiomicrospira sp. ALE5]|uniref:hypothetical protein n=1 Tax=Thiomicrospira sp. ALE5 TaxID=748650 RepID=UPI0008E829AE|nr:hypothetical protein [Thiomicrospira sp. ALE5]SFR52566.1 hypothetical protein SAMN03092900_0708 [Thiomicrospira sp. ALE5]